MMIKKTRSNLIVSTISLLLVSGSFFNVLAGKTLYSNDYEKNNDIKRWVSTNITKINGIGLSSKNAFKGEKSGWIDFDVIEHGHYSYFRIPLQGLDCSKGQQYIAKAHIWIDAPDYCLIRLGGVGMIKYKKADISGLTTAMSAPIIARKKWVEVQTAQLNTAYERNRVCGYHPKTKSVVESLFLSILGAKTGDHIEIFLDNLTIEKLEKKDKKTTTKPINKIFYKDITDRFIWGVYSGIEGLGRFLNVPSHIKAALTAREWKKCFIDAGKAGGRYVHNRSEKEFVKLQKRLDFFAKYGFRAQVNAELLGHSKTAMYNKNVKQDKGAQDLIKFIKRFKDHPAVLAWYLMDEPQCDEHTIKNFWMRGRKLIETIDPNHPVVVALNNYVSAKTYAPYSPVTQIDWYPFHVNRFPGSLPALGVPGIVEIAQEHGANTIWFIPQFFADFDSRREPEAGEVRMQIYALVASGVKAIFPFTYLARAPWYPRGGGGPRTIVDLVYKTPAPMGAEFKKLSRIVPVLAPEAVNRKLVSVDNLVEIKSKPLVGYGRPAIRASFFKGTDDYIILIYNIDSKESSHASFDISKLLKDGMKLYDLNEMKPHELTKGGIFNLSLKPGDGKFLAIADPEKINTIYSSINKTHFEKFYGLVELELQDAIRILPDLKSKTESLKKLKNMADQGKPGNALNELKQLQKSFKQQLLLNDDYRLVKNSLTRLQDDISNTSLMLEECVIRIPWENQTLELRNPRRIAQDTTFRPYSDLLLDLTATYYRLRYGLIHGRLDLCKKVLPTAHKLALEIKELIHKLDQKTQPVITEEIKELNRQCKEQLKELDQVK